ncbi:unnamed protein product [Vitrella brassicaformis CCMP3155]|uniref:DUF676 domain-containing protein n=2 Tax=Vitrella brassicaformis TaxID=1169539 RepID=A0A0G4FPP7_VITBC|nr:unnamed protein product [Vitrella brassicaformis CCMP3155]|eukprot:CEM16399.1 unnamed protein product [Vitrella brassicaformis CCMP3155]
MSEHEEEVSPPSIDGQRSGEREATSCKGVRRRRRRHGHDTDEPGGTEGQQRSWLKYASSRIISAVLWVIGAILWAIGGFSGKRDEYSQALRNCKTTEVEHLIVLQHGMHGLPHTMDRLSDLFLAHFARLQQEARQDGSLSDDTRSSASGDGGDGIDRTPPPPPGPHNVLIHKLHANWGAFHSHFSTADGVDRGGERAAQEIRQVIQQHPSLKYISVLGNSLGGLYLRYALALLYDPQSETIACLEPLYFITTVTPHVGCSEYIFLPVRYGARLLYGIDMFGFFRRTNPPEALARPFMAYGAQPKGELAHSDDQGEETSLLDQLHLAVFAYGRSFLQLLLRDEEQLIVQMSQEGSAYWFALKAFRHRLAYATAKHDPLVPACSQMLLPSSPVSHDWWGAAPAPVDDKYPHVIGTYRTRPSPMPLGLMSNASLHPTDSTRLPSGPPSPPSPSLDPSPTNKGTDQDDNQQPDNSSTTNDAAMSSSQSQSIMSLTDPPLPPPAGAHGASQYAEGTREHAMMASLLRLGWTHTLSLYPFPARTFVHMLVPACRPWAARWLGLGALGEDDVARHLADHLPPILAVA